MAYFNECPECGAYLDPGEECDCVQRRREVRKRQAEAVRLAELGLVQEDMWEQEVLAI